MLTPSKDIKAKIFTLAATISTYDDETIRDYCFDENAHNMIAPTLIIIISTFVFLET